MYHGSTWTSVMCQTKKEGVAEAAETAEASSAAAQQSAAERERSELIIVGSASRCGVLRGRAQLERHRGSAAALVAMKNRHGRSGRES